MLRLISASLLCFFLNASSLVADEVSDRVKITTAEQAFTGGDFPKAAQVYETLVGDGLRNGHVYFNLGNAYYRSGKKGEAIAAYLAARRYLPRDPDISANLKFAKKSITDKVETNIEKPNWFVLLFWTDGFNLKEQSYAGALLFGLGCLCFLGVLIFRPQRWLGLTGLCAWCLAVLLAVGILLSRDFDKDWGAITAASANIYSGPNALTNAVVFELHTGAPFVVLDQDKDWYKIAISDGKKGWVSGQLVKVYN